MINLPLSTYLIELSCRVIHSLTVYDGLFQKLALEVDKTQAFISS